MTYTRSAQGKRISIPWNVHLRYKQARRLLWVALPGFDTQWSLIFRTPIRPIWGSESPKLARSTSGNVDQQPFISTLRRYFYPPPGEGEDGLLEIVELYGLSLDADLVVLSACQTGVERYRHGDGIVSLGQGFSYAGARSVLMTLWTVNDELSGQLMRRTHGRTYPGSSLARSPVDDACFGRSAGGTSLLF